MHLWQWLGKRDRDYVALRRAARTAIVMPAAFALGDKVIGNPDVATFAAFGAFAMLLLVDFSGPIVQRLQAQAALVVVGAILICLATLASATPLLAAAAMAVVGFGVLFAGVVSSTLAGASTALLLAFILPVTIPATSAAIPPRLAGWGISGIAGLIAVGLAWPAPARDRLRAATIATCRAQARRLRADLAYLRSGSDRQLANDRDHAVIEAETAATSMRQTFLATPYRPLRTSARTVARVVAQLGWLDLILAKSTHRPVAMPSRPAVAVQEAAAVVLERGAELLAVTGGDEEGLQAALSQLHTALVGLEDHAAAELPAEPRPPASVDAGMDTGRPPMPDAHVSKLISALD